MKKIDNYIIEKLKIGKDIHQLEFPVHLYMRMATTDVYVARDWLHDNCLTERFGIRLIEKNSNSSAYYDIEIGDEFTRDPEKDLLYMLTWGYWHNSTTGPYENMKQAQERFKAAFKNYDDIKEYINYFSDEQYKNAYDETVKHYNERKNAKH